jgi:hypothetical protein
VCLVFHGFDFNAYVEFGFELGALGRVKALWTAFLPGRFVSSQ